MPKSTAADGSPKRPQRRKYSDQYKRDAVAMLLDGHSAQTVCDRLGIPNTNMLYRWRAKLYDPDTEAESSDETLELAALRAKLREVELERDIRKKALIVFGRLE